MLMVPAVVALREGRHKALAERIAYANQVLSEHAPKGQFATLCAVGWEAGKPTLHVINAGHPPPFVIRKDGRVSAVETPCQSAVGVFPDAEFTAHSLLLHSGDKVLLLSDGITEARDPAGLIYESQMQKDLEALAKRYREPNRLIRELSGSAKRFCGRRGIEDDRTLLILSLPG